VSKALLAVPGVTTALVNDDRSQVTIEGAALERHVLVAAIQDAGYQVLAPTMIALGSDDGASCCGGNSEGCC
jgi:predicted ATPase